MPAPIVVSDSRRLQREQAVSVITPQQYLDGRDADGHTIPKGAPCINLCRDFSVRRSGYYVSLVASSRDQRVTPSMEHLEDLKYRSYYLRVLEETGVPTPALKISSGARWVPRGEMDEADRHKEKTVFAVFGQVADRAVAELCRQVWERYPAPLLQIELFRRLSGRDRRWKVAKVGLAAPDALPKPAYQRLVRALRAGPPPAPRPPRRAGNFYWLAVLWDPDEEPKPSYEETLERFERVAQERKVHVNVITLDEMARLPEYEALFIRTTTGVDNVTFEFAKLAETFGMPVIDDPESIRRCSDKVFLYEIFKRNRVPMPSTVIIQEYDLDSKLERVSYPLILKSPGGSFSLAVKKAEDREAAASLARQMFEDSSVLVAQEYLPTPFDWRVGVLDNEPLFVCRYYMAPSHWQIVRAGGAGVFYEGPVEAVPLAEAPWAVVDAALRAADCIGDGLYGVDVKEGPDGPVVMEVNDNPDIHVGYEDRAEGNVIYERIVDELVRRIRASLRAMSR